MILSLAAGESVAGDRVVTIYFCGTGATSEWYLPEKSGWHTPELIASLYQNDDSYPIAKKSYFAGIVYEIETETGHPHYKYIVDGIGTDFFSLIGQIDPDFGVRGWNLVVAEAFMAIDLIAANHPGDNVILNLVGWSRGGILCMKTARRVANDARISMINILAYDPVPGGFDPIGKFGNDFVLPAKVNQFIGIYALDERTYVFEPVIPARDSASTKMWLVAVPGSHETMMGNFQLDGHSKTPIDPFGIIDWTVEDGMRPVNKVARAVAEQLLTSWEWGEVPLKELAPENSEADFLGAVSAMYAYNYWFVRGVSFLPGWSTYDGCYWLTGRDHQLRIYWALPVIHGRLCFVAPHRHTAEWAWSCALWPVWFPNTDQVYWLEGIVSRMDQNAWNTLQSFRGSPPVDTTSPVPTVLNLPTITGECSVTITLPPTATDDVSGTVAGTTADPVTYTEQGTYTVTWTYDDGHGNTSKQKQTVIVTDTMPPTIAAPAAVTANTGPGAASCGMVVSNAALGVATASDNCSGVISITRSGVPSGNFFPIGTTTITHTATDAAGNTATATQTVTLIDNTPPSISLPANFVKPTDPGQCSAVVNYTVTATDNCPGVPVVSNPPSGSAFPRGTTAVTVTATDAAGNTATGSFTITVVDPELPTITNVSASPSVLWPPNHKLVDVTVNYRVKDNCDQPACTLSVTSNEPINGKGDGDTSPDWEIVGPNKVRLRAERAGSGTGRIYTITISCTDTSGNSLTKTVAVTVRHDQGKK